MTDTFMSGWGKAALDLAKELLQEGELQECMLQVATIERLVKNGGFFSSEQRKELQKVKVDCHKRILQGYRTCNQDQ